MLTGNLISSLTKRTPPEDSGGIDRLFPVWLELSFTCGIVLPWCCQDSLSFVGFTPFFPDYFGLSTCG